MSDSYDGSPVAGAAAGAGAPPAPQKRLDITATRGFPGWLASVQGSLAFTTYQSGKAFFIGLQDDGRLSMFERTIPRCLGMTARGDDLYISSLWQIWKFRNILKSGEDRNGYDRVYKPQMCWVTGDLDIHDMAVDKTGRLLFINTLYSCLATPDSGASFTPLWKPGFISKLAAEDRCHLNGLAMKDGLPRYVTAISESDGPFGWRDHRRSGGVVIDLDTSETVCRGLSMPHSPRWYRDRLWLHNSGTGDFGYIDLKAGRFQSVAFLPGYLRGLDFIGDYAVTGLSRIRTGNTKSFGGLELDEKLAAKNTSSRCGVFIVDLKSGDVSNWFQLEGSVEELYDVVALPGTRRPMTIGFMGDEIVRTVTVGEPQPLRP